MSHPKPLRMASLMVPCVSLALKEGEHGIAANFYRGAEVISPDKAFEELQGYLDAVNEAADLITAAFGRCKHCLVEPVNDRIRPEEVGDHFVHYAHSKPLDEKRFNDTVDWMKSWNLQPKNGGFDKLVAI